MRHLRTAYDREFRGAYFHHLTYDVKFYYMNYCSWTQ